MRKVFIASGYVALLIVMAWCGSWLFHKRQVEEIKPYVTYSRLLYLAEACDDFKKQNNEWPTNLAQLRAFRADLNDWSIDMWGRDAVLSPYSQTLGYGQIISYGQDGKPGGNAEQDRDIEVRFPVAQNVQWNEQVRKQLKTPRFRP